MRNQRLLTIEPEQQILTTPIDREDRATGQTLFDAPCIVASHEFRVTYLYVRKATPSDVWLEATTDGLDLRQFGHPRGSKARPDARGARGSIRG